MSKVQYLDYAGLTELISQIKAADNAVKAYAGTLPEGATQTNVLDYVLAQISASEFSGDAADVSIADEGNLITAENVEDALAEIAGNVATIAGTGDGSFDKAIKDAIGELKIGETTYTTVKGYVDALNVAVLKLIQGETGSLSDLTTTEKGNLVGAINEVDALAKANKAEIGTKKVEASEGVEGKDATGIYKYVDDAVAAVDSTTANKITVKTDITTDNMLKSYTIYQGGEAETNKVAVIDIPKDLVTTGGEIVVNPEGQEAGTYLALTISGQEAPVYIPVGELCDAYTPASGATQIQVAISEENVISATIVAKSITSTELSDAVNEEIAKGQAALIAIGNESQPESEEGKGDGVAATGIYGRLESLEDAVGDGIEGIPTTSIAALFNPVTP